MAEQIFSTPGADTFTWPIGVQQVLVECIGGGQAGDGANINGSNGGDGGDFSSKNLSKSGSTDDVFVGNGGSPNLGAGEDSWFRTSGTVLARGGGSGSSNIGDNTFTGGDGGAGEGDENGAGGGGGEGADGENGNNGQSGSGGVGGAGGTGGDGGDGGSGGDTSNDGNAGVAPGGGGGGGAAGGSSTGGAGAAGQVKVIWTPATLEFIQQPTNQLINLVITPSITVGVFTSESNLDTSINTGTITLSINSGGAGPEISGTLTRSIVNGVATFDDIEFDTNGTYTLLAVTNLTDVDPNSVVSQSFDITAEISIDDGMTLFIHGHNLSNSGIPLYIHGVNVYNSGIPLYAQGYISSNSGIPLYTVAGIPSDSGIPLYTFGHGVSDSGIPLYVLGNGISDSGIPLYIYGNGENSSGIPLYMNSVFLNNSGIPLYTFGHGVSESGIPLYTYGVFTKANGLNLYIGDFGERVDNAMTLYLKNPGSESGFPMVVWGGGFSINPNTTLNGVPIYESIYLYIEGQGAYNNMPLYLNTPTGTIDNSMNLYVNSLLNSNSGIPLYMDTYVTGIKGMKMYSHGF